MKPQLKRADRDAHKGFSKKLGKSFDRKKTLTIIGLVVVFLLIFGLARLNSLFTNISTGQNTKSKPIPKEQKVFNILAMGYGGPGHDGAYLTDTMMFMSIDTQNKRVTIISIPRDIWVEIPTEGEAEPFMRKINSVYQTGLFKENYPAVPKKYAGEQGASELIKEVVGEITGKPIDAYLAIDFDGFKKAVDTLGGVDVKVERTFTDVEYPLDGHESDLCGIEATDSAAFEAKENIATESPVLAYPCRYETLNFSAGLQKMDGETALKYVRSRHSAQDGGDFNRARRQQVFLEAVRDKVLSIGFIPKISPLLNDLEESVRTDISPELMKKLLKEAPDVKNYTTRQIVLTTDNYLMHDISDDGQYILVSKSGADNWTLLQKDLELYLKGITPTPSPVVSPSAGELKKKANQ